MGIEQGVARGKGAAPRHRGVRCRVGKHVPPARRESARSHRSQRVVRGDVLRDHHVGASGASRSIAPKVVGGHNATVLWKEVGVRPVPIGIDRGHVGVRAVGVFWRDGKAAIEFVEVPEAVHEFVVFDVGTQCGHDGLGARNLGHDDFVEGGPVLVGGKRRAVGQGGAIGDVAQAVAGFDAHDASRSVGVGKSKRPVNRVPVERPPNQRAVNFRVCREQAVAWVSVADVARGCEAVAERGGNLVVVVGTHGGMPFGAVKSGVFEIDRVLVPNPLVVVTEGVQGIERRHPVHQHGGVPQPCACSARRSDFGVSRNAKQVILHLCLRRVAIRVRGGGVPRHPKRRHVHVVGRMLNELHVRRIGSGRECRSVPKNAGGAVEVDVPGGQFGALSP